MIIRKQYELSKKIFIKFDVLEYLNTLTKIESIFIQKFQSITPHSNPYYFMN